ncbi:hypothetical protein H072_11145 [Dactylellina haptotyla CBS 200.50]|uniref:Uncharacterized protein n=1 Tax=Dactylellina haptotyla (strain CBS 200.50) TaxID=1284197 RepID=S7ZXI0_DACHA|nr:hypothetical protein H072_11145 [Dactylellina haptotyla CBS 200.50]
MKPTATSPKATKSQGSEQKTVADSKGGASGQPIGNLSGCPHCGAQDISPDGWCYNCGRQVT